MLLILQVSDPQAGTRADRIMLGSCILYQLHFVVSSTYLQVPERPEMQADGFFAQTLIQ